MPHKFSPSNVCGKFRWDWKADEQTLWYFSIATGFLAGGYSETCSQLLTCINYDPETITLNAGESHAQGVEVETTWLINDNFSLRASLGYLDAEYDTFSFDDDPTDAIPGLDLTGLDVPFAAELQFGIEANYDQQLANGGTVQITAGAHYQDEAETSPFDPNAASNGIARHPTYTQLEERTLVNANITYFSADERYHVTLYGKNLTNETYRVSANSVGALWNFTQYGAPRQWGVEFGLNFE